MWILNTTASQLPFRAHNIQINCKSSSITQIYTMSVAQCQLSAEYMQATFCECYFVVLVLVLAVDGWWIVVIVNLPTKMLNSTHLCPIRYYVQQGKVCNYFVLPRNVSNGSKAALLLTIVNWQPPKKNWNFFFLSFYFATLSYL